MKNFLITAAITIALTGCLALGNSSAPPRPTIGQELSDLHRARQSGAITEAEYQSAKATVLKGDR